MQIFKKAPLFSDDVLNQILSEHRLDIIPNIDKIYDWVISWIEIAKNKKEKEVTLEQKFNSYLFQDVLEYILFPSLETSNAYPKPNSKVSGLRGEPDLLLGYFSQTEFTPQVVVELKKPNINLDAIQKISKSKSRTPIEQGFQYANNLETVKWVIVSDMLEIRLYSIDNNEFYQCFKIRDFINKNDKSITDHFRIFYYLINKNSLITNSGQSKTHKILSASNNSQIEIKNGFYEIYRKIRFDLFKAIKLNSPKTYTNKELLKATQKILDRLLFIYYCEDHPDNLLKSFLVRDTIKNAINFPSSSNDKIYKSLKLIFHGIDNGLESPNLTIPKYNGELFKPDVIVDSIELPDALNDIIYETKINKKKIVIHGIWGLHEFDFWKQLNKELLGNIFEKSLSELTILASEEDVTKSDSLAEQKKWGIYYTASLLANYLAESVITQSLLENELIQESLDNISKTKKATDLELIIDNLLIEIKSIKIVDFSCGSGVFLNAALKNLLQPYRNAIESKISKTGDYTIFTELSISKQNEILSSCIHGFDLLPQAVEISKLSLWLTTAKKGESTTSLNKNFIVGNSLDPKNYEQFKSSFNIILGNPPWGGDYDIADSTILLEKYDLNESEWDTWELFILLGHYLLKKNGRIGLVIPDTIHQSKKQKIRAFITDNFIVEKFYNLGSDWFGKDVRMGTCIIQLKKAQPTENNFKSMVIAGDIRKNIIAGNIPFKQIELKYIQTNSQDRVRNDPLKEFKIAYNNRDVDISKVIDTNSYNFKKLVSKFRGEEFSKSGDFWECPNCFNITTTGRQSKGDFKSKICPKCQLELESNNIKKINILKDLNSKKYNLWLDGDVLEHRYINLKKNIFQRIDLRLLKERSNIKVKNDEKYKKARLLIRQAGIGITGTMNYSIAKFPQSIYGFWCNDFARSLGYTEEFLLAALTSRVSHYYLFKRFGEIDTSSNHIKVTLEKLNQFPIPRISKKDIDQVQIITELVKNMIDSEQFNFNIDFQIEFELRKLWNISPQDGMYINSTFDLVHAPKTMKYLFP